MKVMSVSKHMNYIPITNHKSGTHDDLRVTIYPDEYGFGGGRRLIRNPGTRIMPFTEKPRNDSRTVMRKPPLSWCGTVKPLWTGW